MTGSFGAFVRSAVLTLTRIPHRNALLVSWVLLFPQFRPGFLGERSRGQPQGSRFESCNPQMAVQVTRMSKSLFPSFLSLYCLSCPRSWLSTVRVYFCCANYVPFRLKHSSHARFRPTLRKPGKHGTVPCI